MRALSLRVTGVVLAMVGSTACGQSTPSPGATGAAGARRARRAAPAARAAPRRRRPPRRRHRLRLRRRPPLLPRRPRRPAPAVRAPPAPAAPRAPAVRAPPAPAAPRAPAVRAPPAPAAPRAPAVRAPPAPAAPRAPAVRAPPAPAAPRAPAVRAPPAPAAPRRVRSGYTFMNPLQVDLSVIFDADTVANSTPVGQMYGPLVEMDGEGNDYMTEALADSYGQNGTGLPNDGAYAADTRSPEHPARLPRHRWQRPAEQLHPQRAEPEHPDRHLPGRGDVVHDGADLRDLHGGLVEHHAHAQLQ